MSGKLNEFDAQGKTAFELENAKYPEELVKAFGRICARAKTQTTEDILNDARRWAKQLGWSEEQIAKIK